MGQGALSKPVVQWWLSLNSSNHRPLREMIHLIANDDIPTTTRRRRPEKNIPPRTRPRVLARRCSEWAVGMAGPWCSSWVTSRSCRVSRREAQGQI